MNQYKCNWKRRSFVGLVFASVLGLLCTLGSENCIAQEFELSAPQLGMTSRAILSQGNLRVVASDGTVTDYERDARFDSQDRQYRAYRSGVANQILQWPTSNSGPMRIGTVRGNAIEYRQSQMTIRSLGRPANRETTLDARSAQKPVLPPEMPPFVTPVSPGGAVPAPQAGVGEILAGLAVSKLFDAVSGGGRSPESQMLRIASYDQQGSPWLLSRNRGFGLNAVSANRGDGADWWVSPVGSGYVRLQTYNRGRVYSVSADRSGSLSLLPVSQDPRQFWRVAGGRANGRFVLENVGFGGNCLAHVGGGSLALQPITYSAAQSWVPYAAPIVPNYEPFWRSASTEVVPNSQLPPAQLELVNNHKYALITLLGDIRKGNEVEEIRIEPNSSQVIELDRDSGATVVETVEIRSPSGVWDKQQYVTAIPPRALYDLSVYEEHLQSIAIDATGTSPNPIEDVNYVPKSVGWLPLPAGPDMPARGRLDLYERAKAARNSGAVRRMDFEKYDERPNENPLEKILEKFDSTPRRKF